jgi:AcrR family transcriptional regulator
MNEPAPSAHRLATWRRIQSAAVRLVEERGFAAVTVDDIAAAAGTSRRTFFNYFPTKAAALFDPDPEIAQTLLDLVEQAPRTTDPWADLCWICVTFVATGEDAVLAVRRRLVTEFPELGEYQARAHRHVERALSTWARARVPDDPLLSRVLPAAAGAALGAAFRTWDPSDPADDFARLVDRALTLLAVGTSAHDPRRIPPA